MSYKFYFIFFILIVLLSISLSLLHSLFLNSLFSLVSLSLSLYLAFSHPLSQLSTYIWT